MNARDYSSGEAARYWGGERLQHVSRGDVAGEEAAVLGMGQHPNLMRGYHLWETSILDAVLTSDHDRLLDVGCGVGRILAHLAAPGRTLVGLDVAEEMLARARARVEATDDVLFHCAPAHSVPEGDGAFDVVVCLGVFEHLPQATRHAALSEFARVLRPGALLILELNNNRSQFLRSNARDNPYRIAKQLENGYFCELMDAEHVVSTAIGVGLSPQSWFFNAHYSLFRHMAASSEESPDRDDVASCVSLDLVPRSAADGAAWAASDQVIVVFERE